MEGLWSRLPEGTTECVLSFLPLHALCRCRLVCRKWNELVRKQHFLNLWDQNGGKKGLYVFVTCYASDLLTSKCCDEFLRATCFLDLDERRWYSIPTDASLLHGLNVGHTLPLVAMDDSLDYQSSSRCIVRSLHNSIVECKLVMFDPIAKMAWELPTCIGHRTWIDKLPVIVTVIDKAAHSFKVFLMHRNCNYLQGTGFFAYESCTGEWQGLETPSETLGARLKKSLGILLNKFLLSSWNWELLRRSPLCELQL